MSRRSWWTIGFLGVTALAIALELVAAFDDSASTVPWTDYITSLPVWVWAPACAVLVTWLPVHLWRRWRQRRRDQA